MVMVKIFINDEEVKNYEDWEIYSDKNRNELILKIIYKSKKCYFKELKDVEIAPTKKLDANVIYDNKTGCISRIKNAELYGDKYIVVSYLTSNKKYVFNFERIKILQDDKEHGNLLEYFRNTAKRQFLLASDKDDKKIKDNLLKQINSIMAVENTALYSYLNGECNKYVQKKPLIYPFDINETQKEAVEKAFSSQISIIEGPPGTGKTQTILNIVANIVVNGKKCAIISNNNDAVKNIYEKLEKYHLNSIIAKLGKKENREKFFKNMKFQEIPKSEEVDINEIQEISERISHNLSLKNKISLLNVELKELEIELSYLEQWHSLHPELEINFINKYKLNKDKIVNLMVYLNHLLDKPLTFFNRIQLLFNYKIFNPNFLQNNIDKINFIFSLQYTYYKTMIHKKEIEIQEINKKLKHNNYKNDLKDLTQKSLNYFYHYITQNVSTNKLHFTDSTYKSRFNEFLKCFPVIGSGTQSLFNSISNGYLLDYVIIDEASQQDILSGVISFACAKNIIVVGDRKQLKFIPSKGGLKAPNNLYDCEKLSLLDSVIAVFGSKIPKTLLKEHYRCHPKIIQFCNKMFYNNELVPMREDHGEDALSLIVTSKGNHMRTLENRRELESFLKVTDDCGFIDENTGFIAPYNRQVNLAQELLSSEIIKSTVHKFQGRECNEIIFSTVLDKKAQKSPQIDFVDDPRLINVAVSRAKNKFTLVTGKDIFKDNNKYIEPLIKYMKYYAKDDSIFESPVISGFDLLYAEYDSALENLRRRLNKKDSRYESEQIAAAFLREVMEKQEFSRLYFRMQIYLKQIVSTNLTLTEQEQNFIDNGASCDFVIYYDMDKLPIGVIEVDGDHHSTEVQMKRDKLKNSILKKADIPILRLPTTTGDIAIEINTFLNGLIKKDRD